MSSKLTSVIAVTLVTGFVLASGQAAQVSPGEILEAERLARASVADALGQAQPFLDAKGISDYVAAAARFAGYVPSPVVVPPLDDPVRGILGAAQTSHKLQLQAASVREAGRGSQVELARSAPDAVALADREEGVSATHALMWQASYVLALAIDDALASLRDGSYHLPPGHTVFSTPLGDVLLDGGPSPGRLALASTCTDDVYTAYALLIIDECGNDTYVAPAGGAKGLSISIVIDRQGNDTVTPANNDRTANPTTWVPGVGGAIQSGIALAVDEMGDDVRSPGPDSSDSRLGAYGSLVGGAGYDNGYGFLFDLQGDDDYRLKGDWIPKNGGANRSAVGVLVDRSGNDRYGGAMLEMGTGMFGSVGILADLGGDDRYYDHLGYAQGAAISGQGLLLDAAGADLYETRGPVAQGAICKGTGILADLSGNDTYRTSFGAGQGFVYYDYHCLEDLEDLGGGEPLVGLLVDVAGDDLYDSTANGPLVAGSVGFPFFGENAMAQGAAADAPFGNLAMLADLGGNDEYYARERSQGYALWGDPILVHIGLLLDDAGADLYSLLGYDGQGACFDGGPLALLVDGLGVDTYDSPLGLNGPPVDGGGIQQRSWGGESCFAIDLVSGP